MPSHLGNYFRLARQSADLSLDQLALIVASCDESHEAATLIDFLEREGVATDELLALLGDALNIGYPTVEQLLALDGELDVGGGPIVVEAS